MVLLLLLTTVAWSLVVLKIRFEKWSDFIRGLLVLELVTIIAGLSMSAVIIGNDPFSIGFESTDQKLRAAIFITGLYVIFTPLTITSWYYKHKKWVKQNESR